MTTRSGATEATLPRDARAAAQAAMSLARRCAMSLRIAVAGRLSGEGGPAVVLVSTLDGAAMRGAIERSGARGFLAKADLTSPQLLELLGPP